MAVHSWHEPAPVAGDDVWSQLMEYAASGQYLLHGSRSRSLEVLEPRAPIDFSLDDFSKATAVFATEDPTWAIAYAIRSPQCPGFLNACFSFGTQTPSIQNRRIFLSYAHGADSKPSFTDGIVYVVPRGSFRRMPAYEDPQLGWITECQWVSESTVPVLQSIEVSLANLPLVPRSHNAERVRLLSQKNPLGFPWLEHEPEL
ncbi:hypothetical protein AUR04nite_10030 [Glutamicibacter uratoxydans]|uniref:Uncharacterized protein n=2 Tax=Glutamicibacter uratoxydans TaxID=43667 RepID=A0A4Y4DSJ5_GLUUR|nr:hypothetical protein [Glutamicibacter uratoxydans]GED05471.1 hypothetical protein AUR04nite_10030 [Glutamicibacter uratoxydans]